MDKLVTVSIASYNNALYIERCIDSVIEQSYKNLEILIVDDGSRDETMSIIERYKTDQRVKIISKENGGLSSVRQLALDKANGEYISFIDADDYIAPNYVSLMLDKLIRDESDICVCSTMFVDSSIKELPEWTKVFACSNSEAPYHLTPDFFVQPKSELLFQLHLSDSWNKMYRTSFLKEIGVKFSMLKGMNGTDTMFNGIVALHSPKYSTIKDELYIHIIYSSSAVHRKNKNLLGSYQIITEGYVRESQKLGIFDLTSSYIISKYHNNVIEVLIDEYKEYGFWESFKRYKELRKIHTGFVYRVEGLKNKPVKVIDDPATRFCLFVFEKATFILPFLFCLFKYAHKL